MLRKMLCATLLFTCSMVSAQEPQPSVVFDFSEPNAKKHWQTVNDGVMGGRSEGRFRITENGTMEFFGTLSLENNGGFASVRSRAKKLKLGNDAALVARVRGDGRKYTANLYVPTRRIAFSYRADFATANGKWMEVRIPLKDFQATSFGRTLKDAKPVNPEDSSSIGFLLADKKAGPFQLEIDWIKTDANSNSAK